MKQDIKSVSLCYLLIGVANHAFAAPDLDFETHSSVKGQNIVFFRDHSGNGNDRTIVTDWSDLRAFSTRCADGPYCNAGEVAALDVPVDIEHPGYISGAAQVSGTNLKARATTYIKGAINDANGGEINSSYVTAAWTDQWYFEPNVQHQRGSSGVAWVSVAWAGYQRPYLADDATMTEIGPADAYLKLSSEYTDSGGNWHLDGTGYLFSHWTGEGGLTTSMALSFEYGTRVSVSFSLYMIAESYADRYSKMTESDHFQGARITNVLIPREATFDSGAFQAGLASYSIASAVPETETYAMLLVGVGVVGAIARRRANSGSRRSAADVHGSAGQ